ncbi:MAG TPA: prephenate dehydratase domain-containing protein, partial [Candidatus Dormibacteraeota bacterium]|nr:prephenate dehydratase domain-containing protein [Candidatus Dormibacteraeota bacterium]
SEAAAIQLLGPAISTVPRPTFDSAFGAVSEGQADALLAPVENSLAGSVVRVYDLLLDSNLQIVAETILPIEHHLIGCPGASLAGIRSVASHPMALAQCEAFFRAHPELRRIPAEDTAGSVREVIAKGDKSAAAIAGRRAAEKYNAVVLASDIQDGAENFTRFVLLVPRGNGQRGDVRMPNAAPPAQADAMAELRVRQSERAIPSSVVKTCLALRLAHRPGALLAALEPFSRMGINLLKIESRPIHGQPWEYQFFLDVEAERAESLQAAIDEVKPATSDLRILGSYPAERSFSGKKA